MELAALRRLVTALARQGATMTEGERAAACARIARVRGSGRGGVPTDGARLLRTGNRRRHQRSHSQRALDTARQMMAIGQTRDLAANYLDTQDKRIVALRNPVVSPRRPRGVPASSFDALIEKYASLHQVESAVVRAIIETESAFNPSALSHKGAIGLMQLMPMTARELGVNPHIPEQNIEGGVRYFSQLLRMFGGLELALIAYNGGPGYEQRYARGQVALYSETRDYVKKVLARLQALR